MASAESKQLLAKTAFRTVIYLGLAGAFFGAGSMLPPVVEFAAGLHLWHFLALICAILAVAEVLKLLTHVVMAHRKHPAAEGAMIGRLFGLVAFFGIGAAGILACGKGEAVGSFLGMFGGMLLGFSLQAPVSGFAAWIMLSLKRPIRPGDRVQFPNLGLVGDVKDVGAMYTVLDQVGGSIGSEEPVGRYVLVPNAMLFSQVVINYTVKQDAAYMLDELILRISFDSNWQKAERILLDAAETVTADIIQTTGTKPYIRSDLYDYGVNLRLRYQTSVKDRTGIAYSLTKYIFNAVQQTPDVDYAIPFIYSYRAGMESKTGDAPRPEVQKIRQLEVENIQLAHPLEDRKEIEELAESIAKHGLLQPIVVAQQANGKAYDVLAGDKRFEACKRLGWQTVPVVVRGAPEKTKEAALVPAGSHDE